MFRRTFIKICFASLGIGLIPSSFAKDKSKREKFYFDKRGTKVFLDPKTNEIIKNEYSNGSLEYFKNGEWHNENGPAVVSVGSGCELWFINGKLHRTNGPAYIWGNHKKWYVNGNFIKETGRED